MPGSARLNGQANPSGSLTLAWFEWGTSFAYGNVTPPQSVGSGSNAVGFSNVIGGLVIGTNYHFRARASNAFGSLAGLDQTFNLSNQLPVVTTLAADQLTTNSARLRGRGVCPTCYWNKLDIRLNGTNVGEYGRLVASGDVSLTGGSLTASAGFHPQPGQVFTIVEKTSPGLVANEFLGPEGTVTTLNGMPLRLSYIGGDGNDVTLTVEATNTVNVQPTVSIISPTNGAIVAAPFGGTIQANAADSDGTVVRVDFFSDAVLIGSRSNAPFHLAATNIAAGTHTLFAVATDDRGATKRSATVTVTNVTPVPIVLSPVQRSFGTQSVFSYSANVGLSYAVERAVQSGVTWSNWTTIRSNTANVNPMTVADTAATNWMNLYRVRLLPNP